VSRSLIALDIETNPRTGEVPIAPHACADILRMRRAAAVIYSTHSHTSESPRYRIIMPLSEPVAYDRETDVHIPAVAANQLGMQAVVDSSKYRAPSIFFLPRCAELGEEYSVIIPGDPVDSGCVRTVALVVAQRCEADEAERAARRVANRLPPELQARVAAYNASHPIADLLARYGYRRDGNRWKSPFQSAHGQGATTISPDGTTWWSFSESDALAGVGRRPNRASSQCACFGDAFSLFVRFEHGGSFRAALNSLRDSNANR